MMDKRTQKYTANITMGAALKEEAKTVLQHVHIGNSNVRIKQLVMEENLLDKATIASRENVWRLIEGRYLKNPNCPAKLVAQIVASQKGASIVDWVLFYHCCLADTLIYDVTVGLTYHRFISGATRIDKPDIITFLEENKRDNPEMDLFGCFLSAKRLSFSKILAKKGTPKNLKFTFDEV